MRKAVLALLAALVLVAGAAVAVVVYRKHAGHDVRGSSTVEFVPTAIPKPRLPPAAPIVWPTFGFDNARLHVGPPSKLRPPFRTDWVAGGRSLLEFPPAIAFGRLFLANGDGQVFALDTSTGRRAWVYDARRCTAASPAVGTYRHGTVYEALLYPKPCSAKRPNDGEVVALAAGTGRVRWRRRIGASETSPLLSGGRVYVGDWLGKVYALDARTGRIEWTFKTGGAVKGALARSGGRVFAGSYDGHVYALDARTGRLVWKASGDPRLYGHGTFYSTPALAYDRVFIGSTDGKLYSFGAGSGIRRWSHSTGGYVYGSPAVWDRRVYVGSYDHVFYAFDAATGDVDWRFEANGPISGSATVIGGVVYFATLKGRTYALAARTGRLLWSFPEGRYTPVVADRKRLYLLGFGKVFGLVPR
jgi:outer membrane protein assembly factor BamB